MKTTRFSLTTLRSGCVPFPARIIPTLLLCVTCLCAVAQSPSTSPSSAPSSAGPSKPPSKFKEFSEVTQGTTRYDGLFALYKTNETVYGEIKPHTFDQPFLA